MLTDTIKNLVGLRRQLRDANLGRKNYLDDLLYLTEFSTVRLNAGRGAGHTTAIAQLFNQDRSDLVIVGNQMWKKEFQRLGVPSQFVYVETINRLIRPGSERLIEATSTIWVDTASLWAHDAKLSDIYYSVIGEVGYVHGEDRCAHYPIIVLLS